MGVFEIKKAVKNRFLENVRLTMGPEVPHACASTNPIREEVPTNQS